MPERLCAEVVGKGDRRAYKRTAHHPQIDGDCAESNTKGEEGNDGVGVERRRALHRTREDGIEASHEHAADKRDRDAEARDGKLFALALSIRDGIDDDGDGHEQDPEKEQRCVGCRCKDVVENDADHECETDADGEGNGESCKVDRCDEQLVCGIEDNAGKDGQKDRR